jgi:hypothetical protein
MAKIQSNQSDVFFSVAQLRYLETLYPQVAMTPSNSEADMRHYFGKQEVIATVRRKTRGLHANSTTNSTGDIPSPAG